MIKTSDVIGEMEKNETLDANQILNKLLIEENLKFITEINRPLALSILEVIAKECENAGLSFEDSKKLLNELIKDYRINMVSYQRKRSLEIVNAISNAIKNAMNVSFGEKMFGTHDKG